jgi:T-complex protein 1 subunit eta
MDKLIVDSRGEATISNDGATILSLSIVYFLTPPESWGRKLLDVVHPAAKTLVDVARAQDAEVGDGTTSTTLLAAEFLKQCKDFIEEGMNPHIIIKGYRKAAELVRFLAKLGARLM